jgi:uncharacterized membrane protein YgcG
MMKSRRRFSLNARAAVVTAALAVSFHSGAAQAQFTGAAGNVSIKLTVPAGVTKMQTVLTFTARGLASGWASSASFQELAKKINAGIAIVSGGDDLNDNSYPGRCKSGEFNNVPMAFEKLATAANHPELAHIPLIGLGHSHGGDYWNWFNACHPERMVMVFVHASGGVNYSAGALKTPVFYTLGTGDLIENGSKKTRAGMFVNRAKGAPMSMVIGEGGHDTQFGADEYAMVTALIEGIFKMRVPSDADSAKGDVLLNDIVEGENTWVGDLYTKEISTYAAFKGNKALTTFLPTEALANMWKTNGPPLPKSIVLPSDTCSWCGTPKDEAAAKPGGTAPPPASPADAGASTPPEADAGAPPSSDTGGSSGSSSGGASGSNSGGSSGGSNTGGSTGSSSGGSSGDSNTGGSKPAASGGSSGGSGDDTSGSSPSGCNFGGVSGDGAATLVLVLAGLGIVANNSRRRRR